MSEIRDRAQQYYAQREEARRLLSVYSGNGMPGTSEQWAAYEAACDAAEETFQGEPRLVACEQISHGGFRALAQIRMHGLSVRMEVDRNPDPFVTVSIGAEHGHTWLAPVLSLPLDGFFRRLG